MTTRKANNNTLQNKWERAIERGVGEKQELKWEWSDGEGIGSAGKDCESK